MQTSASFAFPRTRPRLALNNQQARRPAKRLRLFLFIKPLTGHRGFLPLARPGVYPFGLYRHSVECRKIYRQVHAFDIKRVRFPRQSQAGPP